MGDVEDWDQRFLRGEIVCLVLASTAIACSDGTTDATSASASSDVRAPASAAGPTSRARPPARERWDPPSAPRPGSFLGDATEDFVGAFRSEGDRVELFAVDGATQKIAWRVPIPGAEDMEHQLRFSVVQKFVAWTIRDNKIRVLDATTGQQLRTIELSPDTIIDRLCPPNTDSDRLLAPTVSGYDAIVHLASGRESRNSGLYPRPACPLVPTPEEPPAMTVRALPNGLVPIASPELVYRPGFLVARPGSQSNERVLVGLDEVGKPILQRALKNLTIVRDVQEQGGRYLVFGNTDSRPESAVLSVLIDSDDPGWTTTLPCPASHFVTTPSRTYAVTDALQLHVLDGVTGKLLATFGDPDPHCP